MKNKNSEIHNSLDKKEKRNFLAISIVKNHEEYRNTKVDVPQCCFDKNNEFEGIEIAIKRVETELFNKQAELNFLKTNFAILKTAELNGWKEFDVSDETLRDSKYFLWSPFIGTQEEYEKLIETLKE